MIDVLATTLYQHRRRVAFIDQYGLNAKTTVNLVGEAPAAHAHLVFSTVRMQWQTDDHALRLPLGEQLRNRIELAVIGRFVDDLQGLRLPYQGVADRNADALEPEIKSQHGHHAQKKTGASRMPRFSAQPVGIDAQQIHCGDEA